MTFLRYTFWGTLFAFFGLAADKSHAIDIQPYDVLTAPPGTAIWTQYFNFGKSNSAYLNGTEVGGSLQSFAIAQRLTYYFDTPGQKALITGIIPYVHLRDGSLSGVPLNETDGIGDTTLAFTYGLYNDTETKRNLDFIAYLGVPTGKYNGFNPLNPGANRTSYALQMSGSYGVGDNWLLEGAIDVSFYRDNKNADGNGSVLAQDPTYAAQAWLSYAVTPTLSLSGGWGTSWGGEQKLNGNASGFSSERQQIRGAISYWVTPTWQILGQVNHDFNVKGGFQADTSYLLRVSKLF
ncbi:transporter [Brucella sp. 21LCYQ03]|nr:transporter [Brucella sp. 21LCYQ03]